MLLIDPDGSTAHLRQARAVAAPAATTSLSGERGYPVAVHAVAERATRYALDWLEGLAAVQQKRAAWQIKWSIEGAPARFESEAIGLGIALATLSALTDVSFDPFLIVTGGLDRTGVLGVKYSAAAWRAATYFASPVLMFPDNNWQDLPEEAATHPGVHLMPVASLREAVAEALGSALPPTRLRNLSQSPVATERANRRSTELTLWVTRPRSHGPMDTILQSHQSEWQVGDDLMVNLRSGLSGYGAVVNVGTSGCCHLIVPAIASPISKVSSIETLRFPSNGNAILTLQGPAGVERLIGYVFPALPRTSTTIFASLDDAESFLRCIAGQPLARQELAFYVTEAPRIGSVVGADTSNVFAPRDIRL